MHSFRRTFETNTKSVYSPFGLGGCKGIFESIFVFLNEQVTLVKYYH